MAAFMVFLMVVPTQDVTEYEVNPDGGYRETKLDQILLNGNNVIPPLPRWAIGASQSKPTLCRWMER
eukprot:249296-Hanusia_phi.AAC.3